MTERQERDKALEESKPDGYHSLSRLEKNAWFFGFLSGWKAAIKYKNKSFGEESNNDSRSAADQVK